jgi:hypothetical protein
MKIIVEVKKIFIFLPQKHLQILQRMAIELIRTTWSCSVHIYMLFYNPPCHSLYFFLTFSFGFLELLLEVIG